MFPDKEFVHIPFKTIKKDFSSKWFKLWKKQIAKF